MTLIPDWKSREQLYDVQWKLDVPWLYQDKENGSVRRLGLLFVNRFTVYAVNITFCIGQSSLGMMCVQVTSIPRGALRIRIGASHLTKSNADTFVRARAHGLFLPRVSGSTLGTPLGGLLQPRGVPSVDPSTLGGISP